MSGLYSIVNVKPEDMTGNQGVLANESRFGIWRSFLDERPIGMYDLAGRIKRASDSNLGVPMPKDEFELGFALLRLLQEGLIKMTGFQGETQVRFKKLHPLAVAPSYAKQGDAGADVRSVETVLIGPGETIAVDIGLAVEIESGFEIQVRPRSGLALNHGITVLNSPGTIDSGYRGPCKVILHNTQSDPYLVEVGDKVAQFVVSRKPSTIFVEVDELSDSERGSGGFGSTGAN